MDASKIIQRGDTVKYQTVITHADFNMEENDFFVIITSAPTCGSLTIEKSDFVTDEDGNYFLVFPSEGMSGIVKAECHYMVTDTDISTGYREEVEYHRLGFVTDNPCPKFACECDCTETDNNVVFTRVYRSDVNTLYLNLRTSEGENILDSEGNQLRVHKAEEDLY